MKVRARFRTHTRQFMPSRAQNVTPTICLKDRESTGAVMVALLRMPYQIGPEIGAERRLFPRKETHCRIDGKRLDHTLAARRDPQLNLALRDLSLGGMSAISQIP